MDRDAKTELVHGRLVEAALIWEKEFIENVRALPFARKAWKELGKAGIDHFARALLFQLHAFADTVPKEMGQGLKKINSRLRNMQRAARHDLALDRAANAQWPFKNDAVKTLADVVTAYPLIGELPFSQSRRLIGDAAQSVTRFGGKQLLMVLRAAAKARGIILSLMALAELWDAADPSRDSDPMNRKNVLQRFFASPEIKLVERHFQRQFESRAEWDLLQISELVRRGISRPLDPQ
jgi:hypothetical protein